MDAEIPYKFNIVNCEKINSQFNFGKLIVNKIMMQEGTYWKWYEDFFPFLFKTDHHLSLFWNSQLSLV